ncbi:MAG TPA: TonB-dependent receptor [Steroidobacteraceae bacterium]|nr:TonB-dependent receptor [Steroidobacteraceae bacterium]
MSKLTVHGALTTASLVSALALLSPTALGQTAPADTAANNNALEEVVVTARYREENLQQTPIAISAITADEIQARGFTTASDIGYDVPNASLRPAQAAFGNTMTAFIRGVGQYDFNFAFEPGVGIYVDDVYYPTTMGTQIDLMDLDRVEVLRGPQGTLFGRGSIGGAIRYISKDPNGSDTGFIEGTVGDFHRVDLRAGYDFAIIPDKLFARVTGVSKKQDGYQKDIDFACQHPTEAGSLPILTHNRLGNCVLGTLGGTDVAGARAAFRYLASDDVSIDMAVDYQRDDSESRADTLLAIGPLTNSVATWNQLMQTTYGVSYDSRFITHNPYVTYATFTDPYSGLSFSPKTSLNQKGISATLNWKITDDVNAKLITAWRNWNSYFATDQDDSPLGFSVVDGIQYFTYRTVEFRLTGKLMDRLEWTAGAFYYHGNGTSAQQVELPAFSPNFALYASDPKGSTFNPLTGESIPNSLLVDGLDVGKFENESGFLHGVYSITDQWHVTAGVRYSSDKKHDDFDNTQFKSPVESDQTHFDWLVGTDYRITDATMVYATASTGYRPPAFNPRPFQASQFVAVKGESMDAYEIGVKSELLDRRLRINAAAFYNNYKQRIVPVGGIDCLNIPGTNTPIQPCIVIPDTNYVNSPGKISGGELEVQFRPVRELMLTASTGYTKFTANDSTTGGITPSGSPIYVPKWNAAASAAYTLTLPNSATVTPRWDAYMQTQICSGVTLTSCTAGYTLHNARIEYSPETRKWTASAGVNNLTNKVYYLNTFDTTPFGEPTVEGQPGMPRAWFLSVRHTF